MAIIDNFNRIRERVAKAAVSSGRDPAEIQIIAVSKTFPESVIQEAIDAGIRVFGENKIQEAKRKLPLLTGDFSFQMIGHLQSNKARDAVALFEVIHSIDKVSTAERVAREAEKLGKKQKILVEVNTSGEASKSGAKPEETLDIVRAISDLDTIDIIGLMAMAPFTDNEEAVRGAFRRTRELRDSISTKTGIDLPELSMGMSSDYLIAIEEGATMVRIGTAIFGTRDYR